MPFLERVHGLAHVSRTSFLQVGREPRANPGFRKHYWKGSWICKSLLDIPLASGIHPWKACLDLQTSPAQASFHVHRWPIDLFNQENSPGEGLPTKANSTDTLPIQERRIRQVSPSNHRKLPRSTFLPENKPQLGEWQSPLSLFREQTPAESVELRDNRKLNVFANVDSINNNYYTNYCTNLIA